MWVSISFLANQVKPIDSHKTEKRTYTYFTQKTRHIGDVFLQKGIESDHMSLLPEENVVR
jgi:hypothetical protein